MSETIELDGVTGVTWTDDDGTTYKRVWSDDGPKDIALSENEVNADQ